MKLPDWVAGPGEVGLEDIDGDAAFLSQAGRERLQACPVAGDQHEVVAPTREALGVGSADAAGGACDEDCGTGGHVSFSGKVKLILECAAPPALWAAMRGQ